MTHDLPGTTRDRLYGQAEWNGREFTVVDTGGWLPGETNSLDVKVSQQSERAMRDADVVLLVVDANIGVAEEDARVADVLRTLPAPAIVVVNKVDDANREAAVWEFMQLGLGEPLPVMPAFPHECYR